MSITRYRLLRLDRIIGSGVVYFLISFLAVLVYYVLVFAGMLVVGSQVIAGPSLGQAFWVSGTALVMLLVLDFVRSRVNRSLESLYRRDKHQLDRTLHQLSDAIAHLVEPPTLARHLLDASAELLAVSRGAMYLADGEPPVFRLAGRLGTLPTANELAPEWRTTPVAVDWTGDGLCDLVMLDHEGYLAIYERFRDGDQLRLKPGRRAFRIEGDGAFDGNHQQVGTADAGLRLNAGVAGKSGRRKFCVVDWNGDGKLDLIVNSANANVLLNLGEHNGVTTFRDLGPLDALKLAGHDTSPTTVDWNGDGVRELLLGAEDGHFYYLRRQD